MSALSASYGSGLTEAGCDEAGRGCLSGPVFAAAVILPADYVNAELNDSKKLSEKARFRLRKIIEKEALAFGVGSLSNQEIDKVNILNASFISMHKAIEQMAIIPDFLLIDGNRFIPYKELPYRCIVKGDGKYMSIAAASILAKTYRDEFMLELSQHFPMYHWDKNKGYPTLEHRKAIAKYGLTPYHRLSFSAQLTLW
jgi:ribonuclease HII